MVVTLQSKKKLILISVAIIVIILAVCFAGFFFIRYRQQQDLLKNPAAAANLEIKTVVDAVGKAVDLPQGETPTLATVSDIQKLKDQPFFAKAQNGDKVLIYTTANEAILYRPSSGKIIAIAPVNMNAQSQASQSADLQNKAQTNPLPSASSQPVRVAILNGTTRAGLTKSAAILIMGKLQNVTVVTKDNAKGNYDKTVVIDISGTNATTASQIAASVNGEVGSMPAQEAKPDADILVILGKNYQ